jgi:transposase
VQGERVTTERTADEWRARVAVLEAALAAERARADAERARAEALEAERDRLHDAYRQLQIDLELLRRRIFVAKAERVDTRQLELEFAAKKKELDALARRLGPDAESKSETPSAQPEKPPRAKPKGRRKVAAVPIAEERCEILDPALEGTAERIGFEYSYLLRWRKGGPVKVVVARAKYRTRTDSGESTVTTTPMPKRAFGRCLAAPSLLAKIATDKFADGLPLFRQEQRFAREGLSLDRGTMCRWLEDLGMTVGCVVLAMKQEALKTAFCIATDATGIAVQPEPSDDKRRRPCRRGHFFVMLADRDHVLFEYMPRETSAAVAHMLRGFSGYVQADAKSVYDVLFRAPRSQTEDDGCSRLEVGCWSHARHKFYEAAIAKDKLAREALFRIHRLFELERSWSGVAPATRKELRQRHAAAEVDAFLAWASAQYELVKAQRGLLRSALGYVVRQRVALRRYLDDGRLRIDNNGSERELRSVAVGRKAWLFVGSDDHAEAAANLFSLISSCRLHRLDPEAYLRDLIRVLPHWPRDRFLELAPRYWSATRARLVERELELPLGDLTVPPPEQ